MNKACKTAVLALGVTQAANVKIISDPNHGDIQNIEYIHVYDIQPVPVYGEAQTIKRWSPDQDSEYLTEVSQLDETEKHSLFSMGTRTMRSAIRRVKAVFSS